ncbi:MAG: glycosyl hydrolase family 88, partial [Bacteroidia bacterium]
MRPHSIFLTVCFLMLTSMTSCRTGQGRNENKLIAGPWSVRMAESEMVRNPSLWTVDFVTEKKWNYTQGLEGLAFIRLSEVTGNEKYFEYAKGFADSLIDENGKIYKYDRTNYNIDQVNPGKM